MNQQQYIHQFSTIFGATSLPPQLYYKEGIAIGVTIQPLTSFSQNPNAKPQCEANMQKLGSQSTQSHLLILTRNASWPG